VPFFQRSGVRSDRKGQWDGLAIHFWHPADETPAPRLSKLAAQTSALHALVQRARMILRLASGQWPATAARALE
jgi:hypothetical protein